MQTYESLDLSQNEAAEIDNLIWYFSELFKNELKIAMGPIERGGAGGGIAAVLNSLYQAEILTSHELVNQITFRKLNSTGRSYYFRRRFERRRSNSRDYNNTYSRTYPTIQQASYCNLCYK